MLVNEINPNISTKRELDIEPFDNGITVEGIDGRLLFTVIDEVDPVKRGVNGPFQMAYLPVCAARTFLLLFE